MSKIEVTDEKRRLTRPPCSVCEKESRYVDGEQKYYCEAHANLKELNKTIWYVQDRWAKK